MPYNLSQRDADWKSPRKALAWALRALPHSSGSSHLTNPEVLETWSQHLVEIGLVHVDYLRSLADENGNIHVSKLPRQQIKFQEPVRGPRTPYNPAGRWVPVHTPEPPVFRVQDPRQLTQQEREAQLNIYRDMGLIPTPPPPQHTASVEK